jgi:hypothetical protein
MPTLDLSTATGLRTANADALEVRIANQAVWTKPPEGPTRAFIRDVAVTVHNVGGSATAKTFNRPANVVAGDLLLVIASTDEDPVTAFSPAPGFAHPTGTAEVSAVGGGASVSISQKVATASEPTTYTHGTFGTTGDGFTIVYAIGNAAAASNTRIAAASSAASSVSITTPTLTPAAAKNLLIRGVAQDSPSGGVAWTPGTPPAGYELLRSQTHPGGWVWLGLWTQDYDTTTATGTRAFTFTNSPVTGRAGAGFTLAIASL